MKVAEPLVKAEPADLLDNRRILAFYRPLALSWLLMAIESPISLGIISRRPFAEASTAAFLVMMSLALWIESPVIDLLSTSTTLAKGRRSFLALRKFVILVMAGVTAVHFLASYTPIYEIVASAMALPPTVADLARNGLMVLLFWSAAIGWRRFLQGVMIRHGETRRIGQGTWIRLGTMAGVGILLHLTTQWDSVTLTAIALLSSVVAEAFFIDRVSRPIVAKLMETEEPESTLRVRDLFKFHWPLTATTMLVLLGNPALSFALARSSNPTISMASWQIAFSLIWISRTIVFALPEVVISLRQSGRHDVVLARFTTLVGAGASFFLLVAVALGLDRVFFIRILEAKPHLVEQARLAVLLCGALPLIGAVQSFYRGYLTAEHRTAARLSAIGVGSAVLVAMLSLGVALKWPGIANASIALTASLAAEMAALIIAGKKVAAGPGLEPGTS